MDTLFGTRFGDEFDTIWASNFELFSDPLQNPESQNKSARNLSETHSVFENRDLEGLLLGTLVGSRFGIDFDGIWGSILDSFWDPLQIPLFKQKVHGAQARVVFF